MSGLQIVTDGFVAAAELAALLFISPASGMERAPAAAELTPAIERALDPGLVHAGTGMHLLSSSFDVRLLGSLADVRVSQSFRNDGKDVISLAGRVPAADENADTLRIHRQGRTVDLLLREDVPQEERGCGGDGIDDSDDDDEAPFDGEGHARLAIDEMIADALQLAPGEAASIELVITQPLSRSGASYQLALPRQPSIEAQALLVDQSDTRFLVIVPHRDARGAARLTLRPDGGASETIELGMLREPAQAFVLPLANRAALQALAAGAIEIETRSDDGVVWSTLPARVRIDPSLALAGAPK